MSQYNKLAFEAEIAQCLRATNVKRILEEQKQFEECDDVLPVIRCKSCRYFRPHAEHKCAHRHGLFKNGTNDFCSYAERSK